MGAGPALASAATAATLGPRARSVHVIHPGVDLERFTPGPADPAFRAQLTADPEAPPAAQSERASISRAVSGAPERASPPGSANQGGIH